MTAYRDADGDVWEVQEDGSVTHVAHPDGTPVTNPSTLPNLVTLHQIWGPISEED